jgi:hypothetical protein
LHLTAAAAPVLEQIAHARAELNEMLVAGIPQKNLDATIDCLLAMKANLATETRIGAKSA